MDPVHFHSCRTVADVCLTAFNNGIDRQTIIGDILASLFFLNNISPTSCKLLRESQAWARPQQWKGLELLLL